MKTATRILAVLAACLACSVTMRAADSFTALLDPYFRIQSALVDDRTDTLGADAAEMVRHAQGLGAEGKSIAGAAAELRSAADLQSARLAFGKLSAAVIAYAEHTKESPGADVATMYCPMVKKSWLQKGEEVRNPYYGKAMPGCGEKKKVG
jgi:membrane fusion protein, copper/silver efflux system